MHIDHLIPSLGILSFRNKAMTLPASDKNRNLFSELVQVSSRFLCDYTHNQSPAQRPSHVKDIGGQKAAVCSRVHCGTAGFWYYVTTLLRVYFYMCPSV